MCPYNINVSVVENNYYLTEDGKNVFVNYFDALYLLNIVFKQHKQYEFIDNFHVESIWNSVEYKYHKFCVIKAYKYELGGYEIHIGDEYKGVCDDLIPKENFTTTYNPLSFEDNPDFKKSYWLRRDNALNSFTDGDENINEHYYIAGFAEKFDYENQKILGLNTPYVNFVINKDKE